MKIQGKLQILLLLVVLIFAAGFCQLKYSEVRRGELLLQDRISEKRAALERVLDLTGLSLKTFAYDYAYWDEMARFVQQKESNWGKENLDLNTLSSFQANALWVYTLDSHLVFTFNNLAVNDLKELPIPHAAIQKLFVHDSQTHFFVNSANGIVEIRGAPIYFSSLKMRNSFPDPQGYYFTGRLWDQSFIRSLSKLLESEITVHPISNNPSVENIDADPRTLVNFSETLHRWDGSSLAKMTLRTSSPILAEVNRSFNKTFILLTLFAITTILLLYVFLWKWITVPLRHIAHALKNEDAAYFKDRKKDDSEFGNLMEMIQQFFSQKAELSQEAINRKEAEESRARLEEQLRQSQKLEAIGLLAGGVAHDFNNILMAIIGYCDLFKTRLRPEDPLLRDAEQIHKSAEQGASLTRQLLAFSRQQVIEPKVLNLNQVLKDFDRMLPRLIGVDVDLSIRLEPNLGCIKADPGQMEQVVMNLVLNARDAMPQGGKLIIETGNIQLEKQHVLNQNEVLSGNYVQLMFSDNGCGMDEKTSSRIFEPFFTTKEVGKGTGLGLSTVYGIVKQSGGHIWVDSTPGHGTSFRICLPRVDESVTSIQPATTQRKTNGSETVLLVDDNDLVRSAIKNLLEMSGYQVMEANQAQHALEFCETYDSKIHLLITDMVMPQMGGKKLAQLVSSQRPEIKTLFISGYTGEETLTPGTDFLQKPVSMKALMMKVRQLLDSTNNSPFQTQ